MSFTWKELQYFLLCRRQRKVWFHLAGKAELSPGNKTTRLGSSYQSLITIKLKLKTWITKTQSFTLYDWKIKPTETSVGFFFLALPTDWFKSISIWHNLFKFLLSVLLLVNLASLSLSDSVFNLFYLSSTLLTSHIKQSLKIMWQPTLHSLYPSSQKGHTP